MKIKVRICELQKGDIIQMDGVEYRVRKVTDEMFIMTYREYDSNKTTRQRNSKMFVYKITGDIYELLDNARIKKSENSIRPIDKEVRPWVGKEYRIGSM